jgi:chromosome segregation ATPase
LRARDKELEEASRLAQRTIQDLNCRLRAADQAMDYLKRDQEKSCKKLQELEVRWEKDLASLALAEAMIKELEARPTLVDQGKMVETIKRLETDLYSQSINVRKLNDQLYRAKQECLSQNTRIKELENSIEEKEAADREAQRTTIPEAILIFVVLVLTLTGGFYIFTTLFNWIWR